MVRNEKERLLSMLPGKERLLAGTGSGSCKAAAEKRSSPASSEEDYYSDEEPSEWTKMLNEYMEKKKVPFCTSKPSQCLQH